MKHVDIDYNKFTIKPYVLILLFLGGLVLTLALSTGESVQLKAATIQTLNQDWVLEELPSGPTTLVLPQQLNMAPGDSVQIHRYLPDAFRHPQTIRLRSSMEDMKVYLNGDKIFDNTLQRRQGRPYVPDGSLWILLDIPENNNGSLLQIEASSDVQIMSVRLNAVTYGARGDLIIDLITGQISSVLFALFILGVAVFTVLISIGVKLGDKKRLNYLALFNLSISIWVVSEMDIMQLFVGSHYFVSVYSYIMIPVATMAFILFMKEVVLGRFSKILNIYAIFSGFYLVVTTLLQRLFNVNHIDGIFIYVVFLVFMMVSIVAMLIYEAYKKTPQASKYLLFIFIMVATVMTESIMFLFGDFMTISKLSDAGIAAFLLFLVIDTLYYVMQMLHKEGEANYLREIAYKDPLTGGHNRSAFEKEIDERLSIKYRKPFRLTMFDLNNLKEINDQYGHLAGDKALKLFYEALESVYQDSGLCYRVGGDEFLVIQNDVQEANHQGCINLLKSQLQAINHHIDYQVDAAFGSDVYEHNARFGDFKHQVDMKMYQNKKESKIGQHVTNSSL